MKAFKAIALTMILAGSMTLAAHADNLVNNNWDTIYFGGVGSEAVSITTSDVDFFATGPIVINVVDCCDPGDQFTVYDNGTLLGTTDLVATGNTFLCGSGDACFANSLLSQGSWVVGTGVNDITIYAASSPLGSGEAFVESVPLAATPEPGSIYLLGSGILGLTGFLRRKLKA